MAIFEFTNLEGKVCRIPWPPRDLSEVEMLYRECGASADEEQVMEDVMIGPKDLLKFSHGAGTGAELGGKIAGDQLVALKEQEKSRLKARGMTDAAANAEAWRRTLAVNRDLLRAYTRQPMGVEDALRRVGQGDVIIQDGGATYHLHDYKALPAEKAPDAAEAKKRLLHLVRERMKAGPADALLDILQSAEGRELLNIVLEGEE